uniref:Ferredoxin-dependent glutamate synthase n=1 Tax=uncultured marine group II/III euryarchaeote AD1000_116_C08 TaxID=1457720 RepID=A0A075FJB5_9EURY|nr:ferredoxin-dependent glutamate synthase [uncultured marine group II/III euryarchaeote AD1000_116_C08]
MIIAFSLYHANLRVRMLESTTEMEYTEGEEKLTLDRFGSESTKIAREIADSYHRYHIDTEEVKDADPLPHRFLVEVGKVGLATLLATETLHYFRPWDWNFDVILARPCTYGVFSGPVGGFAPKPELCVGCMRCAVQHPEFVKVLPNPDLQELGDSYTTHGHITAIDEEARKGMVPVRGQGYRGRFGGPGFDGMLTDMSEIVRPSRDGIHGRELIGTSVDIGSKPMHLTFDSEGRISGLTPEMFTIQVPFVFDLPPGDLGTEELARVVASTGAEIDTIACLDGGLVLREGLDSPYVAPVLDVTMGARASQFPNARMVELSLTPNRSWGWDCSGFEAACDATDAVVAVRIPFEEGWQGLMSDAIDSGAKVIHLLADLHGVGSDGTFVTELFKEAHMMLIEQGRRDQVTLIGAGGIVGADHVPKAIISGLDVVALDLPVLFALQGRSHGSLRERALVSGTLPKNLDEDWAQQRLTNLCGSWRDQMLEILGAMGVREVRRLRGEFGRSMLVSHLEDEAFEDIAGYVGGGH